MFFCFFFFVRISNFSGEFCLMKFMLPRSSPKAKLCWRIPSSPMGPVRPSFFPFPNSWHREHVSWPIICVRTAKSSRTWSILKLPVFYKTMYIVCSFWLAFSRFFRHFIFFFFENRFIFFHFSAYFFTDFRVHKTGEPHGVRRTRRVNSGAGADRAKFLRRNAGDGPKSVAAENRKRHHRVGCKCVWCLIRVCFALCNVILTRNRRSKYCALKRHQKHMSFPPPRPRKGIIIQRNALRQKLPLVPKFSYYMEKKSKTGPSLSCEWLLNPCLCIVGIYFWSIQRSTFTEFLCCWWLFPHSRWSTQYKASTRTRGRSITRSDRASSSFRMADLSGASWRYEIPLAIYCTQYTVHSILYTVHSTQHIVHSITEMMTFFFLPV